MLPQAGILVVLVVHVLPIEADQSRLLLVEVLDLSAKLHFLWICVRVAELAYLLQIEVCVLRTHELLLIWTPLPSSSLALWDLVRSFSRLGPSRRRV